MKILGLIPARKGSKRIPNKNILKIGDQPLIAYTIKCAGHSEYINRIIVSTDSKEIASIAQAYKAEVPFLRPAEISKSDSTELEFLDHTIDWLQENESYIPDLIVLLYPTSPFRKPESIDRAVEKIIEHPEADSLRSITKCSEHPYKMWTVKNGYINPFIASKDNDSHTLSYQLLPEVYIQNASIYITKYSTIKKLRSPTGKIIIPFIMDESESIDINNPIDLKLTEVLIQSYENQ